jgi:hypothetical protein
MRVTLIEDDNGRIRYISPRIYILRPDPKHEGKYIAAGDATENFEVHRHIIKLTDTVYRDNTGMYCLTEAHPFFNVWIINKAVVNNKLDNKFMISNHSAGIRYLVKMALYAASAEYRKHK